LSGYYDARDERKNNNTQEQHTTQQTNKT